MTSGNEEESEENIDRLRCVRSADDLLRYFVEELGWPLKDEALLEDENLEGLIFEEDLEELGKPMRKRFPIKRIRQVRPFTADQPWGIFFLDLAGTRLLKGPPKALLQTLIKRRRSGARNRRFWDIDDLIFVVTTGSGESVELHLLVFFKVGGKNEFSCQSWRPAGCARRLKQVAVELLPQLTWPEDEKNVEQWKATWRAPFPRPGRKIGPAIRLADQMACTARDLRDQIRQAMEQEQGEGPFSDLMEDIRRQLVADIDAKSFSDMCAQTLVYDLLRSRVSDPDGFGATPYTLAPLSNPFLAAFFEQVHGASELDLEGLDQLMADLRETDVEAILKKFESTTKGGDLLIHFYKEFLRPYDPQMRAQAGAFYTPEPAVEFMVRGVDQILKTRFGLKAGVADPSTWEEVSERNGFEVPEGVDPDQPFISMIDPATGTGTFLIHWLRQAKKSFTEAYPNQSWRQHLGEYVLPSMHAFELMLSHYTMAHLKLALHLNDEGLPSEAAQILLTDTLDHDPPQLSLDLMDSRLAEEGKRASELKKSERFTVVIGNPPYDCEQKSPGDTGRRKGGVVRYGATGIEPLINDITLPMKQAGLGKHLKNIYNDYVYFWRWAIWQATELPPGPGLVAFITASSFLDGVSMGGVRSLLRDTFDKIVIVDLGGEGRGVQTEENVFDIPTPVAIALCIKTSEGTSDCTIKYMRLTGSRTTKLQNLVRVQLEGIPEADPLWWTLDVLGT
ncbi:MAG: hypothetical protein OXH95_07385 [bacterium]|nr:hypothetical protein [bacterium]MDE0643933.1 hypothetical protein [bacterium]